MTSLDRNSRASLNLDLVRGLAAMMVFLGHAFGIFFETAADEGVVPGPEHAWQVLFLYGHEAVIVFFVLSGYLVGSGVIRDVDRGRWSWTRFAVHRSTRLYIVLLPALAMGFALDTAGASLFGDHSIYGGGLRFHGIIERVSDWTTLPVFLGNMVFLQRIWIHTLGSNGPLWSLSFEFWYYVIFPLLWLGIRGRSSKGGRALLFMSGVAVLLFIGKHAAARFAIWVLGAGIALVPPLPRFGSRLVGVLLLLGFLAMCALSLSAVGPLSSDILKDGLVGVAFALLTVHMLNSPNRQVGRWRQVLSRSLSHFSYTLYLCHLPFLVLLHALLINQGPQWRSNAAGFALLSGVVLLTLGYAGIFWWLFEYRTDRLRRWMEARMLPGRATR